MYFLGMGRSSVGLIVPAGILSKASMLLVLIAGWVLRKSLIVLESIWISTEFSYKSLYLFYGIQELTPFCILYGKTGRNNIQALLSLGP